MTHFAENLSAVQDYREAQVSKIRKRKYDTVSRFITVNLDQDLDNLRCREPNLVILCNRVCNAHNMPIDDSA
jgi:hypothetical protein